MDKDALYRQRHPDRVRISKKQSYDTHRDEILARRRERYQDTKEIRSKKDRENQAVCSLCNFSFRRPYMVKHLTTRHKLPLEEAHSVLEAVTVNVH